MKLAKYHYLEVAQTLGVNVPVTLFLSQENLTQSLFNDLLSKFCEQNEKDFYIVRSCVSGEDGHTQSMAGHFFSSAPVPAQKLPATVKTCFEENQNRAKKLNFEGAINLMVQPYIQAEIGGVLFSRWKYFSHHCVGELTPGGAQAAVCGEGSALFVLSKRPVYPDLVRSDKVPAKGLLQVLERLEAEFGFPLDIEWVSNGGLVTVVQIRPMTRSVQALSTASAEAITTEKNRLKKISPGTWHINALAESLGELSPLSFSVLEQCYTLNLSVFQDFGFKAKTFNFMTRARNGQVYVNAENYQDFFRFKSWLTPFWQAVKAPAFKNKLQKSFQQYQPQKDFNLKTLSTIFGCWQGANIMAQQEKSAPLSPQTWSEEYEVLRPLELNLPKARTKMDWNDWRALCKQWWLFEYEKLKLEIEKNPLLALATIEERAKSKAEETYRKELPFSVLAYPANFSVTKTKAATTVVKGELNQAPVLVVKNPAAWRGSFPEKCVLVSSYFDNRWVTDMNHFAGIVLEQGGALSHSAIVAREKNIPYRIGWAQATRQFKTGDLID